jgi:hypothetical protein
MIDEIIVVMSKLFQLALEGIACHNGYSHSIFLSNRHGTVGEWFCRDVVDDEKRLRNIKVLPSNIFLLLIS